MGEECINVRVNQQCQVLFILFPDQVAEVVLDVIGKQDGGSDLAGTVACWALFKDLHVHLGAHALAGDLDQPEFTRGQDGVLGTVAFHLIAQLFKEFAPVEPLGHVDEIDHDDAAHIAKAQLACNFGGSFNVDLHGVGLLVLVLVHPVAAVDVDHMHGLGMLDDQVSAAPDGDDLAERILDLLVDPVLVEDRDLACVQFDDAHLVGNDPPDVGPDIVVQYLVVDHDVVERFVERITQDG